MPDNIYIYYIQYVYVYVCACSESVYMKCEWYLYEVRIKARDQHCFKELLLLTVLVQMRGKTQTFSRMIHQSSISQIFTELLHQACLRDKVFFLLWLQMTKNFKDMSVKFFTQRTRLAKFGWEQNMFSFCRRFKINFTLWFYGFIFI